MENIKDLKIVKMTTLLKNKLFRWDRFCGQNNDGYKRIEKYICLRGLRQYFQEQCQEKLEGRNQFKYVLKGEKGKILGFICFMTYKANYRNVMYVQSIAIHPNEQHKGYGKKLIMKILDNPEKYMEATPDVVSAHVCRSNTESYSLFRELGQKREIYPIDDVYDIIEVDYKSIKRKGESTEK